MSLRESIAILEQHILPDFLDFFGELANKGYFNAAPLAKKKLFFHILDQRKFSLAEGVERERAFNFFENQIAGSRSPFLAAHLNQLQSLRRQGGEVKTPLSGSLRQELLKYLQSLSANLENLKINLLISNQDLPAERKQSLREMLANDQVALVQGEDGEFSELVTAENLEKLRLSNAVDRIFTVYNPFSVNNDTRKQLLLTLPQLLSHLKTKTLFRYTETLESGGYTLKKIEEGAVDHFSIQAVSPQGQPVEIRLALEAERQQGVPEAKVVIGQAAAPLQINHYSELLGALGGSKGPIYHPGFLTAPLERDTVSLPSLNWQGPYEEKHQTEMKFASEGKKKVPGQLFAGGILRPKAGMKPVGVSPSSSEEKKSTIGQNSAQTAAAKTGSPRPPLPQGKNQRGENKNEELAAAEAAAGQSSFSQSTSGSGDSSSLSPGLGGGAILFGGGLDPTGFWNAINPFSLL